MGLFKMAAGAIGTTFKDQVVDYFRCDEISETVLMRPGMKVLRGGVVNNATENVITNGSLFDVGVGQCALLVENGKVHDFCAEPGQYKYDSSVEPSFLGAGVKDIGGSFQTMLKRFTAGGQSTNTMKIFYINMKEIFGNKIGIGNVPFRDSEFGFTVKVQGFGNYSYKITQPMFFFENVCGTTYGDYPRSKLDDQLKSELSMAMQPALGKIAAQRICYDQLINYPKEIGKAVNEEMTEEWENRRGISIVSIALASITVDDESSKKIAEFQESRVYTNTQMMGARLGTAQANAMETAAGNSAGAMTGFLGMGFAQQAGGMNAGQLFQMGQQPAAQPAQQEAAPAKESTAPAGNTWTCSCGVADNAGKFCKECGAPKPDGWACSCGAVNKGKFCSECGAKKPEGEPLYKCDKCGWEPTDPKHPPKFCPECGDPFDEGDRK